MKSILLFLSLIINIFCAAQDSIVSGIKYSIYSKQLNEQRSYTISLPQSYYNKKYTPVNYPVFYVLDGEMSFDYMNSIVKFLSKGVYAHIPEMIVVAVHNTNRTRDFTPTKSSIKSPDDSTTILFEGSGGNENFTNFISKELIPHIDSNYRTNTFRIITGHSFGGLAVTNVLLHHTEMFNAYIIHDPSYWWDNEYTLKELKLILPNTNFKKRRVFISQATKEEKGAFDTHFEDIKTFKHIVDSVKNESLAFKYAFYESEDHGTIALPATFDGLKYIFEGFWVDFKKVKDHKKLLAEHYRDFSEKANYQFNPGEPMLDFIVNYFNQQNKKEEAQAILKQYQSLYPKTAPAKL